MNGAAAADDRPWYIALIFPVILLLLGIAIAAGGQDSLKIILTIFGILAVIYAIIYLISSRDMNGFVLLPAIITLVIGVALIAVPNFFSDLLMVIFSISVILFGIILLIGGVRADVSAASRAIGLISAGIMVVAGIIALFNPEGTADILMIIVGAFIAVSGLLGIIGIATSR
ncbi:MAG: DUF308 domain-containing protein [Candidatus Methanomethylophilaceae archaeon]|nr:DUF308 domain-containing protein [Candidatus Methanomethylophilaceae archaeon]